MTALTIITAIAPSSWASYLINREASGIDADDKAQADTWITRLGHGMPASCEDFGFTWTHDALEECPLAADCQRYVFLVKSTSPTVQS